MNSLQKPLYRVNRQIFEHTFNNKTGTGKKPV
jgi:hypothetical protein